MAIMQEAQWFDFEESYRQFQKQQQPVRKEKPVERRKETEEGLSLREKRTLLLFAVAACIVGILFVVSAAFTTTLKYQINELIVANEELEDDIAATEIKIQTANSLTSLEHRATKELGMKYPSSSQIVYIDDISAPKDLASIVSEAANN